MPNPTILPHLTLLDERIAPALARMPKSQRAVSPGWHAALMSDLVTVGKILGGMRRMRSE